VIEIQKSKNPGGSETGTGGEIFGIVQRMDPYPDVELLVLAPSRFLLVFWAFLFCV
jgi:hypothetical protein